MATVNLGAIKFNWKGAYNNSTAYAVDDVVSSSGSSYVCILASQGNAVSNGTYWNIMSSAGTNGTNGTDVGTTLTTQGDILYRDGSGLQRLPKGTANQELRINSGATAPEWYTPSGGGLEMADQWRITANTSSSNQTLTTNWERIDSTSYGQGTLGTGMSQSSGEFTFPSTGIYMVTFFAKFQQASGDSVLITIQGTTNNSSYEIIANAYSTDGGSGDGRGNAMCQTLFDCTSTSNNKVRFGLASINSGSYLGGSTTENDSAVSFTKLGAT